VQYSQLIHALVQILFEERIKHQLNMYDSIGKNKSSEEGEEASRFFLFKEIFKKAQFRDI
jgi:hypothetical protein